MNENTSRNEEIIKLDKADIRRSEIARQFGISRQRVLQICGAKHRPGREGETVIPHELLDDLRMKIARYETSYKEVAEQYHTSLSYTRLLIGDVLSTRRKLGIGRCSRCRRVIQRTEMYGKRCRKCNAESAAEYYRAHRQHSKDSVPCKKCGMLVSPHHLGALNHERWHERQEASSE